eukprot:XP_022277782.1 uncharacterized protein LOC111097064 isoform X2 [Canis lupus familiaris]
MKRGKELEGHTERPEVRGHTQRSISSPNTHPALSSGLGSLAAALTLSTGPSLPSPRPGDNVEPVFSGAARGGRVFSSQPGSEPLFVQVWAGGGGLPAASPRLALDFLTKEAGGSPRGFPLPGENSLLPYIHAYISGTDKSSLFGNKPRRPADSPWPSRTRTASGWERTLTTQNSFTNGLVLSFSSRGPQISLPESSAHSDLAGSTVPQEAGGRLLRRRAGRRSRDPKGRGHPEFPTRQRKKDECCHCTLDLGSLRTALERRR